MSIFWQGFLYGVGSMVALGIVAVLLLLYIATVLSEQWERPKK